MRREYVAKGVKAPEVFLAMCDGCEAAEDDVLFCVTVGPGPVVRVGSWDMFARAGEVVVRLRAKPFRVEAVTHRSRSLYGPT